jgi:hypothetical protein
VDDRVDVIGERLDGGRVDVADDASRGCGVLEQVGEGGSWDGEVGRHPQSVTY